MSALPFHKRYHSDALAGALSMTLEERGAFQTLLDLMYDKGGPVADSDRLLAGYMGVSLRKWHSLRAALIAKGKIYVTSDGDLFNSRAKKEIENALKTSRKRAENGLKGARKKSENAKNSNENNENDLAKAKQSSGYSREPETRNQIEPPNPLNGGLGDAEPDEDEKRALWNDAKSYLGTKRSGQIARWVKDHGLPAVRHALDLAKAENGGAGADEPAAFMAVVLRNGAERLAAKQRAEDEQRRAFDRRFPPRDLSEAEASAMMPPAEFERWKARNRRSSGDREAQVA